MRPVFGSSPKEITGIDRKPLKSTAIYPNPSSGLVYIEGQYDKVWVTDLRGVTYTFSPENISNNLQSINIKHLPRGMYILQVQNKEQVYSTKIFKED